MREDTRPQATAGSNSFPINSLFDFVAGLSTRHPSAAYFMAWVITTLTVITGLLAISLVFQIIRFKTRLDPKDRMARWAKLPARDVAKADKQRSSCGGYPRFFSRKSLGV
jgi:hypothetical protein